jgi:hypothetical protein
MTDLKNILQTGDEPDKEALERYLQGTASEEERFAIESQMADSAFLDDAVEGLQRFKDAGKREDYVEQLNRQLQKYTAVRQERKRKRRLKDQNWLIISILAILLLCVAGFLLIHFYTVKH